MASIFKRGGKRAKGDWYASWFDHNGKRLTKCTRTTDKATAERIAGKHEADAALRRDGVIDPTLDAISKESQRSIESHLADYEANCGQPTAPMNMSTARWDSSARLRHGRDSYPRRTSRPTLLIDMRAS